MKKFVGVILLLLASVISAKAQNTVSAINAAGVATACDNISVACTYTDVAVPPGPHFYFIVSANANGYSGPSNRVDVLVPAGTHNVVLNWSPSPTAGVTYFVYRGAPPTNLGITNSQ